MHIGTLHTETVTAFSDEGDSCKGLSVHRNSRYRTRLLHRVESSRCRMRRRPDECSKGRRRMEDHLRGGDPLRVILPRPNRFLRKRDALNVAVAGSF